MVSCRSTFWLQRGRRKPQIEGGTRKSQVLGATLWIGALKKLLGGCNRERSKELVKFSKRNLRSLTGFLSGHCWLRGHLERIDLGKHGAFKLCGDEEEIPEHPEEIFSLIPTQLLEFIRW